MRALSADQRLGAAQLRAPLQASHHNGNHHNGNQPNSSRPNTNQPSRQLQVFLGRLVRPPIGRLPPGRAPRTKPPPAPPKRLALTVWLQVTVGDGPQRVHLRGLLAPRTKAEAPVNHARRGAASCGW